MARRPWFFGGPETDFGVSGRFLASRLARPMSGQNSVSMSVGPVAGLVTLRWRGCGFWASPREPRFAGPRLSSLVAAVV